MTRRATRTAAILVLGGSILATGFAAPALAADEDQADAEQETERLVTSVRGKDLRLARAKVANRWTRVVDREGDQLLADGTTSVDAPMSSDVVAASVTTANAVAKFVRNWASEYPFGTADTYRGAQADWSRGDAALFVVLDTAAKLDPDVGADMQLIVAWDGNPVQADADEPNPYHGAGSASISGLFNGSWLSGTFDLKGWSPGDPLPDYNAPARDVGRYDRRRGAIVHVARKPRAATAVRLALRSSGAHGESFDEVLPPSGAPWFGLEDALWGLDVRGGAIPLACRSLETYSADSDSVELADPTATIIRQAVGWVDEPTVTQEHLELLASLGETVPVMISPAGSEGEPFEVEADVRVVPGLHAAIFTMEVPAGQWRFEGAEGVDLATPSGELFIDHRPLTGRGGVLTGPGLDGPVVGDVSCARWQAPPACDVVDGELDALFGLEPGGLAETDVRSADQRHLCAGIDEATGEPKFILGIGTDHFDSRQFEAAVAALECPVSDADIGEEAVLIDCRELGYISFLARVLPPGAADADPDGGLSYSIDVVTADLPISDEQLAEVGRTLWAQTAPLIGARDASGAEEGGLSDEPADEADLDEGPTAGDAAEEEPPDPAEPNE